MSWRREVQKIRKAAYRILIATRRIEKLSDLDISEIRVKAKVILEELRDINDC